MLARWVHSLPLKIALVFLAAALAPLAMVGWLAVRTADGLIDNLVTSHLENVAADKQALLQGWIAERKSDLEVVAGSAPVRSMDSAAMAPHVASVQRHYRVYCRFVVADREGTTVFDTAQPAAARCTDEPWHREALAGRRYMSNVQWSAADGEAVFLLAAPVADEQHRPVGTLCATVSTTAILRGVLAVSLGETGECYLVDEAGTFLAHKDPARALRDNIAESESFANIFRPTARGTIYRDYRGIAVLGASRGIAGTPWFLVVEQDEDEAFAPVYQLRRTVWLAIAATLAAVAALTVALTWYLAAPVLALDEAAHALGRGDFDHRLIRTPIRRRDEIGRLLRAFQQMAVQLRQLHEYLQERLGRTEAELQRADLQLKDTLRAAERSEQLAALGRLASGVAHEIRTPLTSLKLYLQSVHEEITLSAEMSEDFEVATRQVERMEATINHFLNFARPQEPVFADVEVPRLVREALIVVRPRANQQGVALVADLPPGLPLVRGDVRQLGETLVNLMVNALEEMPDGGQLTVAAATEADGGRQPPWVRIEVADTGPGIPAADCDRLFEPFYTTKASGSGLGLSIVRATVQRHGGVLRVGNRPQGGAAFTIFLQAGGRAAAAPAPVASPSAPTLASHGPNSDR